MDVIIGRAQVLGAAATVSRRHRALWAWVAAAAGGDGAVGWARLPRGGRWDCVRPPRGVRGDYPDDAAAAVVWACP